MKYKVLKQHIHDERQFTLEDENGEKFEVDFYTGGKFAHPEGVDHTAESWRAWLGTFVGKTLELEKIIPYVYFSSGEQKIISE
jgi:hypothetical protein